MNYLLAYAITLTAIAFLFALHAVISKLNLHTAKKAIQHDYLLFCLIDLIDRSESNTGNEPSISSYYRALDEAKSLVKRIEES